MLVTLPQGVAVLCVGVDGRAALEVALAATPPDAVRSGERAVIPASEVCPCGDDCGPCTDTPLDPGKVVLHTAGGREILVLPSAAMAGCPGPAAPSASSLARVSAPGAGPGSPPGQFYRRFIVLLI